MSYTDAQLKQRDAVSDTPRTDKARGFNDMETAVSAEDMEHLERELAAVTADLEFRRELGALQQQEYDKVTAERDALRADLCTFAVDMEKQLSAVTAERDSMFARFRDEINQRQETQRANAIIDAAILSASQQETRRLREALDAIMASAKVAYCATTDPMMTDALVGIGKRCK